MRPGERRQLLVPARLAFGEGGGPGVPPWTPLVVDVELVARP